MSCWFPTVCSGPNYPQCAIKCIKTQGYQPSSTDIRRLTCILYDDHSFVVARNDIKRNDFGRPAKRPEAMKGKYIDAGLIIDGSDMWIFLAEEGPQSVWKVKVHYEAPTVGQLLQNPG
mmetsp:Transcript_10514/g.18584  ORF Transcript_10514/g.18584 Transcript_10514/m.18584 type:complete len:118 (-) Transcript_10514:883-1236(-)